MTSATGSWLGHDVAWSPGRDEARLDQIGSESTFAG
jgi:hypothetical protein